MAYFICINIHCEAAHWRRPGVSVSKDISTNYSICATIFFIFQVNMQQINIPSTEVIKAAEALLILNEQ